MCGLEYVLIIITATINQIQFVESWDTQIKVLTLLLFYFMHKIIVDATGYSSSFLDLPALPLIPYEFSCSDTKQSLLDCYKYPINCYSMRYYYYYVYGGVTCTQGINFLVIILLYIFSS